MIKATITWVDQLRRKLSSIDLNYVDNLWIKRWIITLQWEARIESPIDKWNLRNLIQYEAQENIWFVRSLAPYSIFVHEGTKFIKKPNPYMIRAKENKEQDIFQDYYDILQNHLNKIWLSN